MLIHYHLQWDRAERKEYWKEITEIWGQGTKTFNNCMQHEHIPVKKEKENPIHTLYNKSQRRKKDLQIPCHFLPALTKRKPPAIICWKNRFCSGISDLPEGRRKIVEDCEIQLLKSWVCIKDRMRYFASSCRGRRHSNFPSQCQESLDIGFKSSKTSPVTTADLQDFKLDGFI